MVCTVCAFKLGLFSMIASFLGSGNKFDRIVKISKEFQIPYRIVQHACCFAIMGGASIGGWGSCADLTNCACVLTGVHSNSSSDSKTIILL